MKVIFLFSLFFFYFGGFQSNPVFAQKQDSIDPQAAMENALKGVHSINDLLENPARRDRYYEAVNDYYQSKIKRNIFDIVLQQIQVLTRENPEVGFRLLRETTNQKSYTLISDIKTYGRSLNGPAWESFLETLFGPADRLLSENPFQKLELISEKIRSFEKSLEGNKKQQGQLRAEFYRKLKQDHGLFARQVVGTLFYTDPAIQSLLHSQDADLILFVFETLLKERLRQQGYPENTLSLLSSVIPRASSLVSDQNLFPIATVVNKRGVRVPAEPLSSTTYDFKPFKRPLHAVWKGLWLGECVGGRDETVTPRRWATAILDKVQNYAVEKNGSFVGFIQELGLQRHGHHAIYYATEFGTPNLKEDILVLDPTTRLPQKRKMIDVWLEKAPKNILRVKSASNAINNAGTLESLNNSPSWNLRVSKGKVSDYQLADQAFADFIVNIAHKNNMGDGATYGKGMISDFTVPDAKDLTVIQNVKWTPQSFTQFLSKKSTSGRTLILMIESNKNLVAQIGIENLLKEMFQRNSAESLAKMTELIFTKRNSPLSNEVLEIIKKLPGGPKALARGIEMEMQKNLEYRDILVSLINMVIQHRLVEAYPVVAQYQSRLDNDSRSRDRFIDVLALEESSQVHLINETVKVLVKNMDALGAENQLKIYKIAEKYRWTEEFRKNIPLGSHTLTNHTLKHEVLPYLARDAIRNGDVAFVKMILKAELGGIKSKSSELNTYNTIVTETLKKQDPRFYELLGADALQGFKFSVRREQLSPEAQLWYDVLDQETSYPEQIAQEISNALGSPPSCRQVFHP